MSKVHLNTCVDDTVCFDTLDLGTLFKIIDSESIYLKINDDCCLEMRDPIESGDTEFRILHFDPDRGVNWFIDDCSRDNFCFSQCSPLSSGMSVVITQR